MSCCKIRNLIRDLLDRSLALNQNRGYNYSILCEGIICSNLIVGEAPGASEERDKRIFIGKSGKLLRMYLEQAGIEKFMITNTICYRPPNNATPTYDETHSYRAIIRELIDILSVRSVLCLGRTAKDLIDSMQLNCSIIYTYHPAYMIYKQDSVEVKQKFYNDILKYKHLISDVALSEYTVYAI